jgi:hypothetical protein
MFLYVIFKIGGKDNTFFGKREILTLAMRKTRKKICETKNYT